MAPPSQSDHAFTPLVNQDKPFEFPCLFSLPLHWLQLASKYHWFFSQSIYKSCHLSLPPNWQNKKLYYQWSPGCDLNMPGTLLLSSHNAGTSRMFFLKLSTWIIPSLLSRLKYNHSKMTTTPHFGNKPFELSLFFSWFVGLFFSL